MHTAIEGLLLVGEWVENGGMGVGKTEGVWGDLRKIGGGCGNPLLPLE